jgi:DNA-directed RNA polymerase subunit RPC12/RpoP
MPSCGAALVSFLWRDYAHGGEQKIMTISAHEFLRRFLLHVLPTGLVRIRHCGLFANRKRGVTLAHCGSLLGAAASSHPLPTQELRCPSCSGIMLIVERPSCAQLYFRPHTPVSTWSYRADTS